MTGDTKSEISIHCCGHHCYCCVPDCLKLTGVKWQPFIIINSQGLRRELGSVMQFSPRVSCDCHLMVTGAGGTLQAFLFTCLMVDAGFSQGLCLLRLSASSLCNLLCPGISHWMEAEFQEQAFWQWARWKLQHLLWHYLRSHKCHMCHIWLVRSESLSLVIIQDYWEISLHLLKQRVSKNRLRFKTTTTAYCPFLHYQTSFDSLPHFYKCLQQARNLGVIFLYLIVKLFFSPSIFDVMKCIVFL